MHLVTLAVIVVFGGMTLLLRDDTFIKWKPTLVNWIFAVLLLGSQWVGRKPLIERMLNSQIDLPGPVWRRLNFSWGVFFLLMGALNVYVAFFYASHLDPQARTDIWVNFKVFGLLGLTLAFAIVQALFLARHMAPMEKEKP
jgi:intracellular septation protein